MAARKTVKVPNDPRQDAEFDRALELLRELVDCSAADREFPLRGNAVDLTSVVLWMLVSQRMTPERSLAAAVKRLIQTHPDFLPKNKRVFEGTLSERTGSYSRVRTRLQRAAAEWFARRVSESLVEATAPSWNGRRVDTVDGTTITLAPVPALRREFSPASNQHGVGVWPVAWRVVTHEMSSVAALWPAVGAMSGVYAVTETALVREQFRQMSPEGIALADFRIRHLCGRLGRAADASRLPVPPDGCAFPVATSASHGGRARRELGHVFADLATQREGTKNSSRSSGRRGHRSSSARSPRPRSTDAMPRDDPAQFGAGTGGLVSPAGRPRDRHPQLQGRVEHGTPGVSHQKSNTQKTHARTRSLKEVPLGVSLRTISVRSQSVRGLTASGSPRSN